MMMMGFILDLEDCIAQRMWSMAEKGERYPAKAEHSWQSLYFEFTRTWHMPQIVWSQQAADPRSAVIGDRGPLSAAEAVCLCHECMPKTQFVCACMLAFSVHMLLFCMHDGKHKWQHMTFAISCPCNLIMCRSVALDGQPLFCKVNQSTSAY